MLHVSDNGQAQPATYEIQKEDSRYFIVSAFKRLYIGYDKIKVFSLWAKADYINISFGINVSGQAQHLLNLVAVEEDKVQQEGKPIQLQFRHNKNGDNENYPSGKSNVSFKLDEYIQANKGKSELTFEITWTEYNGTEKKETVKYPLPTE